MSFNLVKAFYDRNDLEYHNYEHVQSMLDIAQKMNLVMDHMDNLWTAILYHDIVYVPGAKDNEEKSVVLFETLEPNYGGNLFGRDNKDFVKSLIMATKYHHISDDSTVWHKIIIDLDLYNLGGTWSEYILNHKKVQREYINAGYRNEWNAARLSFLNTFLERDRIYLTDLFPEREIQARNNLKKEKFIIENELHTDGIYIR